MIKKPKEAYYKLDNGFSKPQMLRRIKDRIYELYEEDENDIVHATDIARLAGCSDSSAQNYLRGATPMSIEFLFWLCIRLGVSSDYLLGLSDEK